MNKLSRNYICNPCFSCSRSVPLFFSQLYPLLQKIIRFVRDVFQEMIFMLKLNSPRYRSVNLKFRLDPSQIITKEMPSIKNSDDLMGFYEECLHEAWQKGAKCIILPQMDLPKIPRLQTGIPGLDGSHIDLNEIEISKLNKFIEILPKGLKLEVYLWPTTKNSSIELFRAGSSIKIPDLIFTFSSSSGHDISNSFELRTLDESDISSYKLPREIWLLILNKLDERSLNNSATTCKLFNDLANKSRINSMSVRKTLRLNPNNKIMFFEKEKAFVVVPKRKIYMSGRFDRSNANCQERFEIVIKNLPDKSAIMWPYRHTDQAIGENYYTIKKNEKIKIAHCRMLDSDSVERKLKSKNIFLAAKDSFPDATKPTDKSFSCRQVSSFQG